MTSHVQLNDDLWSLYAQTVVRFDYYASEKFSESYQIANFKRDVARQQKVLHPHIAETTSLKMFEPQGEEIGRFCEFHNSPLFDSVQMDVWQRIHKAIAYTLSLHDRINIRSAAGRFPLKIHLENICKIFQTNHIPLFDPEDFEPDMIESLSGNTPCPGCHITWLCSDYSWYYIRTLMVAAMLSQGDCLLSWLKIIAEVRYNTELCEEYREILQYESLFQWRDPVTLTHEVYEHALIMVDDIKSRLAAHECYGTSKL